MELERTSLIYGYPKYTVKEKRVLRKPGIPKVLQSSILIILSNFTMYLQELVLQSESVKCNNSNARTLNKPMPTLASNSITTRVLRKHGTTLVMHIDNL